MAGARAFDTAGRVAELLAALLAQAEVRPDNVRRNIDRSCITITELADTLVRSERLSFRQAHEIATATARAVVAEDSVLSQGFPAFRDAFAQHAGRATTLDEAAFREAVGPERFVAVRDRFGGPAPAAMDEALESYGATLAALDARAAAHQDRQQAADALLQDRFDALRTSAQEV